MSNKILNRREIWEKANTPDKALNGGYRFKNNIYGDTFRNYGTTIHNDGELHQMLLTRADTPNEYSKILTEDELAKYSGIDCEGRYGEKDCSCFQYCDRKGDCCDIKGACTTQCDPNCWQRGNTYSSDTCLGNSLCGCYIYGR